MKLTVKKIRYIINHKKKGEWDSDFKDHILKHGIKPILARVKHPQTNGKLEKFFDAYRRFRNQFPTFEDVH